MNILIAPDSFKGSVTAKVAAQAMERGVRVAIPNAHIKLVPMADGGEGTMISLVEATHGSIHKTKVQDPLGRDIMGEYGVTGDGKTAIVELASASGLHTLQDEERDPRVTSTYGTGQLILHALKQGYRHFIVCLGGSSTNDGGTGLLKALGFRFLDQQGRDLPPGGWALRNLHSIDDSNVHPEVSEAVFQVACDVDNPLLGENGASAVFGPQKGATPEMVRELDQALKVFSDCVQRQKGVSFQEHKGTGAAGGTAYGLIAFLSAELKPGIEIVKKAVHFRDLLQKHAIDLLLTGEGKVDGQTAAGKVIAGLAETAKEFRIPTVAIAGSVETDHLAALYNKGLTAAFSILQAPISLKEAMEDAENLIAKQTEQIMRLIRTF